MPQFRKSGVQPHSANALLLPADQSSTRADMKEMEQVIALVITVFCAALFVNGACAANEAAHVFWTYVESNDLQVRVAKVDGFEGPVNAIFSAGFDASTLEPPTKQQRYWGLVQDSLIDTTVDVGKEHSSDPSGILRGRDYLFIMASAVFGLGVVAMLSNIMFASPSKIAQSALNLSVQTFLNGVLITSIYGFYWDSTLQIAYIQYVPGWAYFWTFLCFALEILLAFCGISGMILAKATGSAKCFLLCFRGPVLVVAIGFFLVSFYTLFTVAIPLVGYTWSFCWVSLQRASRVLDTPVSYCTPTAGLYASSPPTRALLTQTTSARGAPSCRSSSLTACVADLRRQCRGAEPR